MGDRKQELQCLEWAVTAINKQKGSSRRILKYFSAPEFPNHGQVRPDFIKRVMTEGKNKKDILLGIEHFSVNHHSKENHTEDGVSDRIPRLPIADVT